MSLIFQNYAVFIITSDNNLSNILIDMSKTNRKTEQRIESTLFAYIIPHASVHLFKGNTMETNFLSEQEERAIYINKVAFKGLRLITKYHLQMTLDMRNS